MPHCIISSVTNTFGGEKNQGYVKEILKISISPCWEISTVNKSVLKAAERHPLTSASDRLPEGSTVVIRVPHSQ